MQIFFFFLIFDSIIFYVKVRTFVRVIFKNYTQPMLLFYHAMIMSSVACPWSVVLSGYSRLLPPLKLVAMIYNIAEILLKVALKHQKSNHQSKS